MDPIPTLGLTVADVDALVVRVQELMRKNVEELGYSKLYDEEDENVIADEEEIVGSDEMDLNVEDENRPLISAKL